MQRKLQKVGPRNCLQQYVLSILNDVYMSTFTKPERQLKYALHLTSLDRGFMLFL